MTDPACAHAFPFQEGEAAGAVHAPFFPEPKYEEWWLFLMERNENCASGGEKWNGSKVIVCLEGLLTAAAFCSLVWCSDVGQLLNFVRCKNLERVVKETIQFRVIRPGKNRLTVLAMCDSYAGCDAACEVDFKGKSAFIETLVYLHEVL